MELTRLIEKVRKTAEQLKASRSGNEANTKALLIEPLLAGLGWDFGDLDQVDREYRVYDGTCLDYALKVEGRPRLFVEAKGVNRKLGDKAFIAQAVNYANNEGVQWCVLTNGLAYRVYKTNEPVGMEEKLLFEVDLGEVSAIGELDLIGRAAVTEGRLDEWGDRVFTDSRVRQALAALARNPPRDLLERIEKLLGQPQIDKQRLRGSLARILGDRPDAALPARTTKRAGRKAKRAGVSSPRKARQDYPLDRHLTGKPAAMVDLFEQLDTAGQALGGDVTRRIRKFYVGYYAGSKERSFFTAEIQRQKIIVYINLDPTMVRPWNEPPMRDVRNIGHYGMGDTEYVLSTAEQLGELTTLIKRAYDRVH